MDFCKNERCGDTPFLTNSRILRILYAFPFIFKAYPAHSNPILPRLWRGLRLRNTGCVVPATTPQYHHFWVSRHVFCHMVHPEGSISKLVSSVLISAGPEWDLRTVSSFSVAPMLVTEGGFPHLKYFQGYVRWVPYSYGREEILRKWFGNGEDDSL